MPRRRATPVTGTRDAGVAALHGTRLDTMASGAGPLHGSGWIVAIPVVVGALAVLLLLARRKAPLTVRTIARGWNILNPS